MFTEFDVIVCVIILISVVGSFIRGAAKDTLTLLGYLFAAWATLFFQPYAAALTDPLFKSPQMVNVAAIILIFIASLLLISLFNAMLLDSLRDFCKTPVDRSLGLLLGLGKGLVIVSLMHFAITSIAGKEPGWLEAGETYDLTRKGSEMADSWLGEYFEEKKEALQEEMEVIEDWTE